MKYQFLKTYINDYSENILILIKYWLKNEDVLIIFKKHKIETEFFIKNYALKIVKYFFNIIRKNDKIKKDTIIDDLLIYLKNKNIPSSELFVIYNNFRNALIQLTYDLKIMNFEIEKEINQLFEKNFVYILDKHEKNLLKVERELSKKSNIIDKYVIMSKVDTSGKIVDVSEALCDISGYRVEELIGKDHSIIQHPSISKEFYKQMWDTLKEGNIWQGEIKNLKKNGGYYWVDMIISPVFDSNKNIIAYEAIRQNITHQKELEKQQGILIEQSKSAAMGEMISMIAHQWRQPLQAVSILIQKLPLTKMIEGEISDELLEQVVQKIGIQLDYMSKTIDDFRDFFLPDKPKESVEISTVINKALDFVSFLLKKDSISINLDIKTDKKFVVHVNELIQVLINLFKNAHDVMNERKIENKEINILVFEKNNCLIIEIEDNAGGVEKENINKIFKPYFSTKNNKNGTGLGLYMCKTIIEKYSNGKISVSNSKKGAIFKIELPFE